MQLLRRRPFSPWHCSHLHCLPGPCWNFHLEPDCAVMTRLCDCCSLGLAAIVLTALILTTPPTFCLPASALLTASGSQGSPLPRVCLPSATDQRELVYKQPSSLTPGQENSKAPVLHCSSQNFPAQGNCRCSLQWSGSLPAPLPLSPGEVLAGITWQMRCQHRSVRLRVSSGRSPGLRTEMRSAQHSE